MTVSWMVVPGRLITAPILVHRFSQEQTEHGAITEEEREEEGERKRLKVGAGWYQRVLVPLSTAKSSKLFSLTSPLNCCQGVNAFSVSVFSAAPKQDRRYGAARAGARRSSNIATWEIIKSSCSR